MGIVHWRVKKPFSKMLKTADIAGDDMKDCAAAVSLRPQR